MRSPPAPLPARTSAGKEGKRVPGANTMTSFSRYSPGFREVGSQRAGAGRGPGNRGAGSWRARGARAGRSAPRTAPRARSRAAAQLWARATSTMHCCAGGRRRANTAQLILGPRASLAIHRLRSRALLPLPPEQERRKEKPDRKVIARFPGRRITNCF